MNETKILLVEDSEDDAELAKRAFRKNEITNEVLWFQDGIDALEYLFGKGKFAGRDTREQPGLALVDLKLIRTDGIEVLRQMKNDPRTSCIPVVILTTSRQSIDLKTAYDEGANSYICKPVDFEEFTRVMGHVGRYWLQLNESPNILE